MIDLHQFANNVESVSQGLWKASRVSSVSYPEEGNTECLQVEETSFWFKHRNDCILAAVKNFSPKGPIFDIGGGNGFVSQALKSKGYSPIVVEPGLVGAQNSLRRGLSPVICSTLEDVNFKSHSLPAVGLFDVIEHIKEDCRFLQQLNDLLNPEGKIYITVPAYSWLWSQEDVRAGHYRRYTQSTLCSVLDSAGFKMEYCTYIFSILVPPIFLFRALPSFLKLSTRNKNPLESGDHVLKQGLTHQVFESLFRIEISRIQRALCIPFGTSLLAVAKKR